MAAGLLIAIVLNVVLTCIVIVLIMKLNSSDIKELQKELKICKYACGVLEEERDLFEELYNKAESNNVNREEMR